VAYFENTPSCFGKLSRTNEGVTDSPSWDTHVVIPKRRMDRSDTLQDTGIHGGCMGIVDPGTRAAAANPVATGI